MDIIIPKSEVNKPEEPPKEAETSINIDSQTKVMQIQINLTKGVVNAYGTLQYGMELACRYFTTLEIMKKKKEMEDQQSSRILVPRR